MTNGEFLLRDRKVLCLDEDALLHEAQVVTQRVWQRMIAQNPDLAPPPGGLHWHET
jgi:5-methylthioadenosine/S-adenosylhomocysteine deaminase